MPTPDHLGLPELPRLPHGSPLGWHVLLYQFVWRKTVVYRGGGAFFWWLLPGMYVILGLMSTVKKKEEKEAKQKNEVGKEK